MKLQKALKRTALNLNSTELEFEPESYAVLNLNLNHMLIISLYPFLDVDSFIAIREVTLWQLACHVENMGYGERKHGLCLIHDLGKVM